MRGGDLARGDHPGRRGRGLAAEPLRQRPLAACSRHRPRLSGRRRGRGRARDLAQRRRPREALRLLAPGRRGAACLVGAALVATKLLTWPRKISGFLSSTSRSGSSSPACRRRITRSPRWSTRPAGSSPFAPSPTCASGILLGSLLVDHDVTNEGSRTWIDELLADPKHRKRGRGGDPRGRTRCRRRPQARRRRPRSGPTRLRGNASAPSPVVGRDLAGCAPEPRRPSA